MPAYSIVVDRSSVTSSDGTTISVLRARPPQGTPSADLPPVLAVHGFASSAQSGWQRTGHLISLARAGRTVIAPDLRGHGRSDRPHTTEAYGLAAVLDDLVAASGVAVTDSRTRPAAGQIDLLGYSLGARLCWTLACERRLPVRRMVLGGFDGRPLFQGVDTDRLEALAAGVPGNDTAALHHLVIGLTGSGGTPPECRPPTVPTLVVAGERDPLASRAGQLAARLPAGSFLAVPGRNHISAVPAATFRDAVVDFLAVAQGEPPDA